MPTRERTRERESEGEAVEERDPIRRFHEATPISRERYEDACDYMPGGSTRNAVYHAPYPAYLDAGEGAYVTDVDGNEYVDFLNNYTTLIHGHAPEGVVERAVERTRKGSALGGPSGVQIEWAKHLVERADAIEKIRFGNSGTEATMNCVRAARAYTGNDVIAKFEGSYHGTHDDAQVSVHPPTHLAGPADDPASVPESAGLPASTTDDVIALPFNDADATIEKLERRADDLAGVMLSPLLGSAIVPGDQSFVEAVDEWTTDRDVPLIFDEVISFRVAYGGVHETYGVTPDLVALGKIIGGGFPVGAFGGSDEHMAAFDPRGGTDVSHSGTFNANPVTAAAGLEALERYTPDEVDRINEMAGAIATRCREVIDDRGYRIQFHRYGSLFNVFFAEGPIQNHRDAAKSAGDLERQCYFELLDEGVRLAPKLLGCTSTAMGEPEVDRFVEAFDAALGRLRPTVEVEAPHLVE